MIQVFSVGYRLVIGFLLTKEVQFAEMLSSYEETSFLRVGQGLWAELGCNESHKKL